jgi:hypothetical protein
MKIGVVSMSSFKLGEPDWYTVQNAEENDFLNQRLESVQYGIYYSVKFEGDAETFLWQTKSAPVEGEKYYGHIEQSKSGKSLRFKKDKVEEAKTAQGGSGQSTDESIARAVALRHAAVIAAALGDNMPNVEEVLKLADTFLYWLKGETPEPKGDESKQDEKHDPEEQYSYVDPNEIPPEFR